MHFFEKYDIINKKDGEHMSDREYEYDRYEVKLSRFMNIQKEYWWCLRGLLYYVLIAVLSIFVYGEHFSFLAVL